MVIILHKMIMTGAMCIVAPGSSIQLLVAVLIQMFYMLLVLKVAPYENASEDYTSIVASLCLTMTMIGGFALITDNPSNQTYQTNLLGIVLIGQNIFCITIDILIVIWFDCGCKEKFGNNTNIELLNNKSTTSSSTKKKNTTQVLPIQNKIENKFENNIENTDETTMQENAQKAWDIEQ